MMIMESSMMMLSKMDWSTMGIFIGFAIMRMLPARLTGGI